ncbi:MAG: hypothetical protein ACI4QA_03640 [Candidatus Spyradosoma sp.]
MKKYLITAAVLLTGTALTNAETVLTTTFGNAAQATASNVTLTNTWSAGLDPEVLALLDPVTGSVTSFSALSSSGSAIATPYLTSGTVGPITSFFSPNVNVGTAKLGLRHSPIPEELPASRASIPSR